jgi:hypothetical protein
MACASQPQSPFFGDEKYLRFGVDPHAEADTLVAKHRDKDQYLALRLQGQNFTALGFMDRSGRATGVRVVTALGIELALDAEPLTALTGGVRYALLAPPIKDTHDADGDGFEELFIERRRPEANCLLVYRVRDVGYVDPVAIDASLFGLDSCAIAMSDIDGDGRIELLVPVVLPGFQGESPQLTVPLWAAAHRFSLHGNPRALEHYVAAERAQREPALEHARRRLDFAASYRRAVELAALSYLLGDAPKDQVAAFDRALAGIVLGAAQQRSLTAARAQIFEVWNRSSDRTPDTRPTPNELVHNAGR